MPFSDVPPSFVYDTPQLLRAPVQARIVNGQEVFPAGKYPWMVGIVGVRTNFLGEEDESFWCGGTLVSPDFVMSASHCFFDTAGVPAATPFDFFRVKIGAHDIDEPRLAIDVALEDIAGDPRYVGATFEYDVAILRLSVSADKETFPPARLSWDESDYVEGANTFVVGWARTRTTCSTLSCTRRLCRWSAARRAWRPAPTPAPRKPPAPFSIRCCAPASRGGAWTRARGTAAAL